MSETEILERPRALSPMVGISERREHGVVILSPAERRPFRRVLYVNSYGGVKTLDRIKNRNLPAHHLWGCLELVRMGYEVALAEPLAHFSAYRKQLPHDLRLLKLARSWLGRDDIIYCAHTLLFWLPLLKMLGGLNRRMVSLTYAREELDFCRTHSGIIAMTAAAADQAKKMAPNVKVAHIPWGVDLSAFPKLPYNPQWFLSCGLTQRDHHTLSRAAQQSQRPIRVISPKLPPDISWSANVKTITGGNHDNTISYSELFNDYYSQCAASLIILKYDPTEYTAVGFTNLTEAMAMARPVILSRTGAVPSELDVQKAGCGLLVPPDDPEALASAIETLASDPEKAEAMGRKGRELAESYYNIERYSNALHKFFEEL